MNQFYKRQIELNLEQAIYWLMNAQQDMKKGESAVYSLLTATEYANKVDIYRARLDEKGETNLDWETLTREAYKKAELQINKEQ